MQNITSTCFKRAYSVSTKYEKEDEEGENIRRNTRL